MQAETPGAGSVHTAVLPDQESPSGTGLANPTGTRPTGTRPSGAGNAEPGNAEPGIAGSGSSRDQGSAAFGAYLQQEVQLPRIGLLASVVVALLLVWGSFELGVQRGVVRAETRLAKSSGTQDAGKGALANSKGQLPGDPSASSSQGKTAQGGLGERGVGTRPGQGGTERLASKKPRGGSEKNSKIGVIADELRDSASGKQDEAGANAGDSTQLSSKGGSKSTETGGRTRARTGLRIVSWPVSEQSAVRARALRKHLRESGFKLADWYVTRDRKFYFIGIPYDPAAPSSLSDRELADQMLKKLHALGKLRQKDVSFDYGSVERYEY